MSWIKQKIRFESLSISLLMILTALTSLHASPLPSKADIIDVMIKVNDYWLDNNPDLGDKSWARAVYYTGNMALYQVYPDVKYLDVALRWANKSPRWGLEGNSHNKLAAGQSYINLYHIEPIESHLMALQEEVQRQIDQLGDDLWFTVDANYMAMPTYAWLAKVERDDPDIYRKMWALHLHNKDLRDENEGGGGSGIPLGLYDPIDHLWYRDRRYIESNQLSPNGNKVFWSRGNGWVFAASVRVLQTLPASDLNRHKFIETFQDMAAELKDRQLDSGFWPVNLDDPLHAQTVNPNYRDAPETSGTALFCYGIAWGINNKLLRRADYQEVVEKAWHGLANTAVRSDGLLGYVQGVGQRPESDQPFGEERTADFGVGAFLLAGSEVLKMARGDMPVPPELGTNLALDHLSASSEEQFYNPATNAVDGDINNRWSAQGYDQWIEVDLGEVKQIYRTEVYPYRFRAYQFKIEAKEDMNDPYTIIVDRRNNTDGGTAITNIFNSVDARYLRLSVEGVHPLSYSGSRVSIKEFKVFESSEAPQYMFEAE
jgi:rhamnogalacturonyl hydrolase YesR